MAELQVSELPLITNITIDDMLIVNDANATTSICSWADALASIRQLQGQVLFDNGVETLPSISFVNDISTGIYNPNQGEVAISTNAVQRFVVDGSGRVGVSNYAPSAYNNDANNIVIGDTDLGDNGITIVAGGTYAGLINFADGTGVDASAGQILYDHSDDHMGFHTSGTESMRINFEGDVTIGTSLNQLGSRLTVDGGSITVDSGTSSIPSFNFVGDGDTGIFNPSPDNVAIVTGGIAHAFFDAEGQMGIGVQDALADIHIRRDNPVIRIEDSSQPGFPYATASTSNGDVIIDADPADFAVDSKILLRVDGQEQIRVDNGGSLIINNDVYFNDPANGTVNAYGVITHDTTTGSIIIGSDPDNQYANSVLSVEVDGTEQVQIRENGDIDLVNDGNVTFGSDSDTYLYHPAADQLALTTAGQERLRIGDLGHILIGSTAPRFIAQNSPGLQVSGNAPTASAAFMIYNDTAQGTGIHLGKSRSTQIGGVNAVQVGDQLGYASFSGADGSSMNSVGASIVAIVDNWVTTNSVPTSVMVTTTGVGDTTTTPRLLVESKGTARVINSPAADTALAVGLDGQETFKVTTEGDVTMQNLYVENVNLSQLDWLPGTGP